MHQCTAAVHRCPVRPMQCSATECLYALCVPPQVSVDGHSVQPHLHQPTEADVRTWGLPPRAPFSHTVDFHKALLAHGVPHAYNPHLRNCKSLLPGRKCLVGSALGGHRWSREWMRTVLDFFVWEQQQEEKSSLSSSYRRPAEAT